MIVKIFGDDTWRREINIVEKLIESPENTDIRVVKEIHDIFLWEVVWSFSRSSDCKVCCELSIDLFVNNLYWISSKNYVDV